MGFLIILFFHKRIFKSSEETAETDGTETAAIPGNEMIPSEINTPLHNNNLPAGFENPKQDADNSTTGSEEDKNR
jgi:hypothetical protein